MPYLASGREGGQQIIYDTGFTHVSFTVYVKSLSLLAVAEILCCSIDILAEEVIVCTYQFPHPWLIGNTFKLHLAVLYHIGILTLVSLEGGFHAAERCFVHSHVIRVCWIESFTGLVLLVEHLHRIIKAAELHGWFASTMQGCSIKARYRFEHPLRRLLDWQQYYIAYARAGSLKRAEPAQHLVRRDLFFIFKSKINFKMRLGERVLLAVECYG